MTPLDYSAFKADLILIPLNLLKENERNKPNCAKHCRDGHVCFPR